MQVENFIVHKLKKEQHKREATVELRDDPLPIDETIQRLVEQLHKLYSSRLGKGYGRFEESEDEYPTVKYVRQHYADDELSFVEMTQRMMQHLANRASQELLASGGYVLFTTITNDNTEYLLVAMVTDVVGAAITEQLAVAASIHLDMSQLRVAGRISLTAWRADKERYIGFLKGRSDVAEYFKLFLGCNDVLEALKETQKLVRGLETFAETQGLSTEAKDSLFEDAHGYLEQLRKDGTPVSLEALINRLWPEEPELLRSTLISDELSLSDGFVPDRRATRRLIKFEGKSDYWKLTFDRKAIRSGHLKYDRNRDTIVLSSIPDHLRQELIEELNDEQGEI
ncbi:nucleoid-associated protein [Jeongeupia wiesaeckerbachi]|uniref:nucleoid-associated protein n=1 Tax=Jeongeupia wiesaeckerbachi TaxID=3051218 RepID=UPI003D801774